MVIRMGGFHVVRKLSCRSGKEISIVRHRGYLNRIWNVWHFDNLDPVERKVLQSWSKGPQECNGSHAPPAMVCIRAMAISTWDSHVDETLVIEQIIACLQTLDEGKDVSTAVWSVRCHHHIIISSVCDAIIILQSQFTVFKSEVQRKCQLFAFWDEYVCMVQLIFQFIKAERTGDLLNHVSATAAMIPHFFSMDRPNYSGWLLGYLADRYQLSETHPAIHEEFMSGNHSICRSTQPFA